VVITGVLSPHMLEPDDHFPRAAGRPESIRSQEFAAKVFVSENLPLSRPESKIRRIAASKRLVPKIRYRGTR